RIGIKEFFNICLNQILLLDKPFALAAITKGCSETDIKVTRAILCVEVGIRYVSPTRGAP
ncbi:hypothetical protein, partial [Candidatus Phytoplasma fabacearum]|uniref:hypothetical protein n=1 Tax=Candidatus Phytoplasma fabacearum TaxID=2982628 RepID=UPI0030ED13C2